MYLSRLEILGFKSFQQKTDVKFNPGLTGIVGPNGCGKTNIVDAIRWALGEQKSSTLRSDKMENVIFNGTATKKPMGMAEVSLVIENHKGLLPSEYNEVVITRRIFRSGESEYLLNRNLCRLKDITSLFMDTGMGANAYSVIELKMVESILSNKADERRVMFEEAAGVNKYKLRRRLSLKKLDEVRLDLNRVNDIISEVEKRVATLERQAKRADKFNVLSSQLKEIELEFVSRKLALLELEKQALYIRKDETAQRRSLIDAEIDSLEENLNGLKHELDAIEEQLREKRNAITAETEKIHHASQAVSVTDERRKSLQKNLLTYEKEIEDLKQDEEYTSSLIEEYKERIEELSSELATLRVRKEEIESTKDIRAEELEKKRAGLDNFSQALLKKHRDLSYLENQIAALRKTIDGEAAQLRQREEQKLRQDEKAVKSAQFLDNLQKDRAETESQIASAETELAEAQKRKEQLEQLLSSLRKQEADEKNLLFSIKDKITFIKNLIDNLEGFSKGSKLLMEKDEWTSGQKNLLGNLGNTPVKFRLAVESALRNNINNIIVSSIDDVLKGISLLKSGNAGKASFYFASAEEEKPKGLAGFFRSYIRKKDRKKLEQSEGFISWVYDAIETETRWKPFFSKIVHDFVITDTLESALKLSAKYREYTFTTLEGDIVYPSGVIEAGSIPGPDETIFGRKKLLEELNGAVPGHEENLALLQGEIHKAEEELSFIDLKTISDRIKVLNNEINSIERQINQFEYEKKKAEEESERLAGEIKTISVSLETNRSQIAQNESEYTSFKDAVKADEEQANTLQLEYKKSEQENAELITTLNDAIVSIERKGGEIRNLESSIKNSEQNIINIQQRIEKRRKDIETAQDEYDYLEELNTERRIELTELQNGRELLRGEEKQIDDLSKEKKVVVVQIESDVHKKRKEKEALGDEIFQIELSLNQLALNIGNLIDHTKESYGVEPEVKEYDDLGTYDFDGIQNQINELKQSRKNLGAINFDAYTEYEEEKTRMEFLQGQRDDLTVAETDLLKTIEEINETAQTLFMDTFNKIRAHYISIFRKLFNEGDEADLRLEEDADPLEAKIEIIAKPKGKRPLTIEQLSGGEKTLTAIALLFAIYMVKPSPFCILDEIDAPLDDANIDRFTRIIRDFSKDTQFIIITHNKRTMEATDALYGITMQEIGVSKLVSVKFNEELGISA
ncbi:MAG: chromosome segregation protein SMC [Ignavibacteriales bacterium]|nr:MAG: chromosome segregation protein SMC [Ignavibacteriales bacterium]